VGGVKEIGETGKEDRGKIVDLRFEIADWRFVLRTPTLRAGSQFRIADFSSEKSEKGFLGNGQHPITYSP
jgi:hypothetical protein